MQDINTLLKKIQKTDQTEFTTKELKSLSLTPYFIKKLTIIGNLQRLQRGKYRFVKSKSKFTFAHFKNAILKKEYVKGFHILKKLYLLPETQNSLEHNTLYFILLKELLAKENIDFSFMETLPPFPIENKDKIEGYYIHFVNFKEAIYKSDFYTALSELEIFTNEQKIRGQSKISSILFGVLTEDVTLLGKEKNEIEENVNYGKTLKVEEKVSSLSEEEVEERIYQYLEEENYEKAYSLLQKACEQFPSNRFYRYTAYFIEILKRIEERKSIPFPQNTPYIADEEDRFKRFFEALRKNDFAYALTCALECQKKLEITNPYDREFLYYINLLTQIVDSQDYILKTIPEIKKIEAELNAYCTYKTYLDWKALKEVKALLERKLFLDENATLLEKQLLELIDVIEEASKNETVTADSFARLPIMDPNLIGAFQKAMQYGDYITAYEKITDPEWITKTQKYPGKKYLILAKKVLRQLHYVLERNVKASFLKKPKEEVIEEIENVEHTHLKTIKSLVKKRDYIGAYVYYMENDMRIDDTVFPVLLEFLLRIELSDTKKYLDKAYWYYARGDLENAKSWLDTYKEFFTGKVLDRDLEYHYKKFEQSEKMCQHPQFVLSENIYDRAMFYCKQGNYEEASHLVDQYIELIGDITSKGYALKGHICESQHDLKSAIENYKKALEICPIPRICHRLARCYTFTNRPLEAIANHLLVETYCSYFSPSNLRDLAEAYWKAGDAPQYKVYKKKEEIAKKINQKLKT